MSVDNRDYAVGKARKRNGYQERSAFRMSEADKLLLAAQQESIRKLKKRLAIAAVVVSLALLLAWALLR